MKPAQLFSLIILFATASSAFGSDVPRCGDRLDLDRERRVLEFVRAEIELETEGLIKDPSLTVLGHRRSGTKIQCVVGVAINPEVGGRDGFHCVLLDEEDRVAHPPTFPTHFGLDAMSAVSEYRRGQGAPPHRGSAAEFTARGWRVFVSSGEGNESVGEVYDVEIGSDLNLTVKRIVDSAKP